MQRCGYCDSPTVDLKVSTIGLMEGAMVCVDCRRECALCGSVGVPDDPEPAPRPRERWRFRRLWRPSSAFMNSF